MPDGTEGDSGMPLGAVAKRLGVGQHDDGHAVVGGSTPSAPTKNTALEHHQLCST